MSTKYSLSEEFRAATDLLTSGRYEEAIEAFEQLARNAPAEAPAAANSVGGNCSGGALRGGGRPCDSRGMTTPKTPEELALRIEGLVAAYVNEAQRVAQDALARSFSRSGGGSDKTTRAKPALTRQQGPRRTPGQLAELADRLAAAISEQPGESMALFAGQLGVSVRDLYQPMTMLKDQRRIRSVGRRQATRYFPTALARAGA